MSLRPQTTLYSLLKGVIFTAALFQPPLLVGAPPDHSKTAVTVKKTRSPASIPKGIPLPEKLKGTAVLIYDATPGVEESQRVLYPRNIDQPLPMASTTKLMTALLVYEKTGLQGEVSVVKADTKADPTSIPLRVGQTASVDNLTRALLIISANDAALALARHTAGSVPAFVDLMNERAKELGCTHTLFVNPNGLPPPHGQPNHTTVSDLRKILSAVTAIPELREIMSERTYQFKKGDKPRESHNHLLGKFPDTVGKTGFTNAALYAYAAELNEAGHTIYLTSLHSIQRQDEDGQIAFKWALQHLPKIAEPAEPKEPALEPALDPSRFEKGPWLSADFSGIERPSLPLSPSLPEELFIPPALPGRKEY